LLQGLFCGLSLFCILLVQLPSSSEPTLQDVQEISADNRNDIQWRRRLYTFIFKLKLKLKSHCDRPSVGQFLVSGTHLGPATNFSLSLKCPLDNCGFIIL
jgi:hypothetical protein